MNTPARGKPDFLLLFLAISLVGFGLMMVFSSSSAYALYKYDTMWYFTKKQIIFSFVGLLLMIILMNVPFHIFKRLSRPLLLISIILLILVLVLGVQINGAKRWIGYGSFGIQPTEFVKLSIVIFLSALISKKREKIREFKTGLFPLLFITGLVALLILLQPDFGSSLILLLISGILIIMGGANLWHLLKIMLVIAPLCIYLAVSKSYRLARITSFMNPWEDGTGTGYQLIQSLFALGHGGLTGTGIGRSIQKLHYLPEAHTDFIFAIMGEELGFLGLLLFILMYALFLARGFILSVQSSDSFGLLLGTGIVSMIAVQFIFNIGAVTGGLPITGVPLPLISYGGSSLLVCMAGIGILLSISRERNRLRNMK
ncbi:cell division protein FtsW [Paenibacillus sp. 1_12]|uniref:putative lipid II flippase FtsW n=1 Tax=Paenibacillus sp. 1_12 TaxID=1566278 RepID=UPI0008E5B992|nr:putative lipid II flippase FtsW [Paenibacillus sp. 1_12]SFL38675.1 cell division protein FtsW [Paenibacillus sp. 1_12]